MDTSLSGERVTRVLDRVIEERGARYGERVRRRRVIIQQQRTSELLARKRWDMWHRSRE